MGLADLVVGAEVGEAVEVAAVAVEVAGVKAMAGPAGSKEPAASERGRVPPSFLLPED